MSAPSLLFQPLPAPLTRDGQARLVGVEIEFTRLSERGAAQCLSALIGGTVEEEDPHAFRLTGSRLGDIGIELDMRHVHPGREGPARRLGPLSLWLGAVVSPLVPRELITGPLPVERLSELDGVVQALRTAGARGEGVILTDSLGLHFNVMPEATDAGTLLRLLQAYLVSEPALRQATLTSGLMRFHAPPPYAADYVRRVLSADYRPDLATLCADYVAANPTRKRSLDLLPLFLELFPDIGHRISGKVKPRAVLHYRLPLAYVGRPGWSLAADWNHWVAVEALADDPGRLTEACRQALR
ncbi:amidoligase family protein [Ancylobacter polymorphus]|uniref:Amidoligase family protein n=1 Tax=Ancylobacter polymorphus TaxID=223390 RepID=A0A9E7CVD5_9HYPH|nr:amidoligase family protein [Ancylobacter polymorphus]UOK69354.1 amidoligase family protein [Ancylobacter polymorphus]